MSVQQVQRRRGRQASRLRAAPQALQQFIELVNSVPPGQELPELPDFYEVLGEVGSRRSGRGVAHWERMINDLPTDLRKYIGPVRLDTALAVYDKYSHLRVAGKTLRYIAHMDKSAGSVHPKFPASGVLRLSVGQGGRIQIVHGALIGALEGVEAARIRECPICSRIFWARRIDQPCCTSRCASDLRTRRWRSGYPNNYRHQRAKKRQIRRVAKDKQRREELKSKVRHRRAPRLPGSSTTQ
jgi:hypothetical protein